MISEILFGGFITHVIESRTTDFDNGKQQE